MQYLTIGEMRLLYEIVYGNLPELDECTLFISSRYVTLSVGYSDLQINWENDLCISGMVFGKEDYQIDPKNIPVKQQVKIADLLEAWDFVMP